MPFFEKKISEQKFTEGKLYKDAESLEINCKLGESTFINPLLHFIFAYLVTDRSCMTFVPLALSKDTTHLYTAECRVVHIMPE